MTTEITTKTEQAQGSPFAKSLTAHVNAGTVTIESERAIAEAQGKIIIAKRCPRDVQESVNEITHACRQPSLADVAFYSYPKGGQQVSGPSIRLAEEIARCWGNIDYGIRELSQKQGESEYEAYCWDMQTNTSSSQKFTVKHELHTRQGVRKLTDPRDIYEIGANQAGRRLRARIMAVIPKWLQEHAIEECKKTLAGGNTETTAQSSERTQKMVAAFAKLGVELGHIEKKVGKKLDQFTPDDLVELVGIHNSIRDGISKPSQWFDGITDTSSESNPNPNVEELNAAAKKAEGKKPTATPKGDAKPQPTAESATPNNSDDLM